MGNCASSPTASNQDTNMIHHGTDLVVKLKLGTPGAKAGLDAAPGKEAVKSYRPVKDAAAQFRAHRSPLTQRLAIAATSPDGVAAKVVSHPKTRETKRLIYEAIQYNLLFRDLPLGAMELIIDGMAPLAASSGADIIKEGDTDAERFFVLEEGECHVFKSVRDPAADPSAPPATKLVKTYKAGSAFGELALLYSAPRAATVVATQPCKLWVMERATYNAVRRNFLQADCAAKHKLLDAVPMLRHLSTQHKAVLVEALREVSFPPGATIFKKGDPGNEFYVIKSGRALVKNGATVLTALDGGQHFGERALLGGAEVRAATVQVDPDSQGPLVAYVLSHDQFVALLGPYEHIWAFEALKQVAVLHPLSEAQLWDLARNMGRARYKAGEPVFKKGQPGDDFFVVEKGAFTVYDDSGAEVNRITAGGCFGELALMGRNVRAANVSAVADSEVMVLHRDKFNKLLGSLETIRNMWRIQQLRKVPLLAGLQAEQYAALAKAFTPLSYRAGSDVVTQGQPGDQFFLLEHGTAQVFKDGRGPLMEYGPNDYFGELALLNQDKRAATVRAVSDVSVLALHAAAFAELLGPLVPLMREQSHAYAATMRLGQQPQMKDIKILATLGTGGFGQVHLVRHQGRCLALKCMNKRFIIEHGLLEHVLRERALMLGCSCPWIVNLDATLQDEKHVYWLMEACMGGELFAYMQALQRPMAEAQARFYAASVVLALEYLHGQGLVYRDLKPENLLLDSQGYLRVADFGFVKKLPRGGRTFTLCGTPEYLAPEVITRKGSAQPADWWALGVLLYELCAGAPPFMEEDRLAMFKRVCACEYEMPQGLSRELKDLVARLLVRNPASRLGAGPAGAADVRNHRWFHGFDWAAFRAKTMPAPYVPRIKSPEEAAANFKPVKEPAHFAAYRQKHYVSQGHFKDF